MDRIGFRRIYDMVFIESNKKYLKDISIIRNRKRNREGKDPEVNLSKWFSLITNRGVRPTLKCKTKELSQNKGNNHTTIYNCN